MSNVLDFPHQRTSEQQRRADIHEVAGYVQQRKADRQAPAISFLPYRPEASKPAEALEQSLDTYRSTVLELAHKREAFELQMRMEANTAQIRLEAAAYKALVTGVPENDIYALGEDMAEALDSAMKTVAGA